MELDKLDKSLGLAPTSSRVTDIDMDQVCVRLVDGWLYLLVRQQQEFVTVPIAEWIAAALHRGHVMVTLGQQAWNGDGLLLDAYLADSPSIRMGLVGVDAATTPDQV